MTSTMVGSGYEQIVLFGLEDDPHLLELRDRIKRNGINTVYFSVSHNSLRHTLMEVEKIGNEYIISMQQSGLRISTSNVSAAFCLTPIEHLPEDADQEFRYWHFSWREAIFLFYDFVASANKFVNTSIYNGIRAQNKGVLLSTAERCDLRVPHSIISNSSKSICRAAEKWDSKVALKTLHQMSLKFGDEPTMLKTTLITLSAIQSMSNQGECPVFVQQFVDKLFDVRVTVCGERIIACKIDASASPKGKVDYRYYDWPNTVHESITIPYDLELSIIKLMDCLHLHFCTIDFCVDKAGTYWILDVNPFGRYLWIDKAIGTDITGAVADMLVEFMA